MNKQVNIVNGTGTGEFINGNYEVSANVVGYDNASLNPNSVNIVEGTNTYNFTISASGTLILHVTEEGTAGGTPVVGATFARTDADGNQYGSTITTDSEGNATFNNVPFAATSAPEVYYKQLNSDGDHEFDSSVQSVNLTASSTTLEIQNARGAERTINLTDANYPNLAINTGTLTFELEEV